MPKLQPGSQAPDLSLMSVEGTGIRLSDLWKQGVIALTFYRGDFCPACNQHLHSLEERADAFREAGVRIAAVSADRPDLERQTVARHGLSFPVLSDPDHRAIDAYDVVYDEREGHAEPAVFLISPEGVVLYEAITSGPLGHPSADDVLMIGRGINKRRRAAKQEAT